MPVADAGALLGRLLAIADDAVIVVDEAHNVVLFNEGAERTFGCRAADALGAPLTRWIPPADRERHEQHLRRFGTSARASKRMGERSQVRGQRADGTLFDAEASIAHLEIDGRMFFTAVLRDVSEERTAARALADSEARFRALATAAPVGIFQCDARGHCVYVNERWSEITGLAAGESAGHGWAAAVHPGDRVRVREAWQTSLDTALPFHQRYRFLHADGHDTWVVGNAVPQRGVDGCVSGWIGTVTDITDSVERAAALERAKSEAEAAARAKSLFLANMSHEIRTPLNAVIGMTTLLLDTPMSDDQRDFAQTIQSSSEALLDVINDILDYSKADVGKLELERRAFDLRRVIEESLDLVNPRALEKGLNLAYQIDEGTPEALVGDALRLRQILVNLLSNAVKFTPQGDVLVSAAGRTSDDGRIELHLCVEDTGIGIAAEQLPLLFQRFTQVDPSTTRKYGGTGLGLAITKRLAELMGGRVDVQSAPGQGSSFHVWLRLDGAAAAPQAPFLQRNAPALAGKRILIVDDNQNNRRILTRFALLWGMQPSTLPSALEALDRVRHGEPFDVALLDMSMPECDGVELARRLRRCPGAQTLPLVLLTSLGQRALAALGGDAPISACLSKPIKAAPLYDALVAVLAQERAPELGPAPTAPATAATPLRVLVAEDHPINQRVVTRLLKHLGHLAEIAHDGAEAIEMASKAHYDVVLMDIQMPEIDGLQATRAIVRRRGPQGLPRIIAMTANAMPGDRDACIEAGMDGYLAKPIELRDLADALRPVSAAAGSGEPGLAQMAVDVSRLEHLRSMQDDSQPSLVRELIDMFDADSVAHVQRIEQAHAHGDATALRTLSHRFLSATQNIGALRLSALCAEIESCARDGRLGDAAAAINRLGSERHRAQAALAALRLRF